MWRQWLTTMPDAKAAGPPRVVTEASPGLIITVPLARERPKAMRRAASDTYLL